MRFVAAGISPRRDFRDLALFQDDFSGPEVSVARSTARLYKCSLTTRKIINLVIAHAGWYVINGELDGARLSINESPLCIEARSRFKIFVARFNR